MEVGRYEREREREKVRKIAASLLGLQQQ